MRYILLLLVAIPALAAAAPHSGVAKVRTGPELSDLALFAMAAGGVYLVRRTMRARARRSED